jgi:Tol biopolymer transport system component
VPLPAGTRLGPYEIIAAIGEGGMGEVYRGRDPRLGRDVAIKLLPEAFSANADRLRRFEQEARAAAALSHPNILAVYDIGTDKGAPYIVSELLEGATLRELLERGPIPIRKSVDWAIQIAKGVAAANDKGIVHRDLKPENLFVTADGHIKILDFGLARLQLATLADGASMTSPAVTTVGTVLGTAGYMSPEQVRGQETDHRTDIFTFGAVLYEMLSGERAFKGATPADTMSAILNKDAGDLSRLLAESGSGAQLDRIVAHCLEKDPGARFQSARDLVFALQYPSSGSTPSASAAALARSKSAATRSGREWAAWGAAAVFFVSTLGLIAADYLRPAPAAAAVVRVVIPVPEGAAIIRSLRARPDANPLALSPDGRYLAFAASVGNTSFLWLRPLDSLTATRLDGTEGAVGPFWSPDSQSIAFSANGALKRVGVSGGDPQTICEANAFGGGSWSQDDVILFSPSLAGEGGLVRVPARGGVPSTVTKRDPEHGETNHVWPYFLPDGHSFLYNVFGRDNSGIYVGSLDSATRTKLVSFDRVPGDVGLSTLAYAPGYLFYVRGQTLTAQPVDPEDFKPSGPAVPVAEGLEKIGPGSAAFSVSHTGVLAYWSGTGTPPSQLTWRARDGTVTSRVGPPGGYLSLSLSPDERRIAVGRVDPGSQSAIWVLDSTRGNAIKVSSDAVSFGPIWSPDNLSLAFGSTRYGPPSLIQKAASGSSQEVLLLNSGNSNVPTDWCADGRTVVFGTTDVQTQGDVWMLPLIGERTPVALLQTRFNEALGRCSPNSRWLAYTSDESGRPEVYVTSFPKPGDRWPISTGGGTEPQWRRDGTELFYLAPDGTVMAVRVGAGTVFEAGAAAALFKTGGSSYAPTDDGRRFITNEPIGAGSNPITLVLNWTAALKK